MPAIYFSISIWIPARLTHCVLLCFTRDFAFDSPAANPQKTANKRNRRKRKIVAKPAIWTFKFLSPTAVRINWHCEMANKNRQRECQCLPHSLYFIWFFSIFPPSGSVWMMDADFAQCPEMPQKCTRNASKCTKLKCRAAIAVWIYGDAGNFKVLHATRAERLLMKSCPDPRPFLARWIVGSSRQAPPWGSAIKNA